jgi:hypothetical protein
MFSVLGDDQLHSGAIQLMFPFSFVYYACLQHRLRREYQQANLLYGSLDCFELCVCVCVCVCVC